MHADAATSILLSPPDVGEVEIRKVVAAMRSGWVAPAGPDLLAFETAVAERCDVPHAVALSSGTAALHLALASWGVGPGDIVVTSTLTFAATANAIRYTGAAPHFVDCEPNAGNIDPALVHQALEELQRDGRRVVALLPVDLLGKCADYEALTETARQGGLRLLSDAAESFGSSRCGVQAGAAGDAAVLSFNGNKIMTTSGGGMLLTRDEALARHVRHLSTQARESAEHYEHQEVGYNYRLSNILAALGLGQLERLDDMMRRRRQWREGYRGVVESMPGVDLLGGADDTTDNCWLTALVIDPDVAGVERHTVSEKLRQAGIETRPIWKPMHLQPVYRRASATLNGTAQRLFQYGLTVPSGSGMTDQQFERVCAALVGALGA